MNLEKAKAFMFTAVGILALVTAFWLGGQSVKTARATTNPEVVGFGGSAYILLENGDIWHWDTVNYPNSWEYVCTWEAPVSARDSNWSRLKGSYKE